MKNEIEIQQIDGSTHYDITFKCHLKIINGNLCVLSGSGLWVKSLHRLGVGAIEHEEAIIELQNIT